MRSQADRFILARMILTSNDEYDDVMMIRISHDENHSSGKFASSRGWIHNDAEGEIVITITKTLTIFNIIILSAFDIQG